jgi:hypothetical protein
MWRVAELKQVNVTHRVRPAIGLSLGVLDATIHREEYEQGVYMRSLLNWMAKIKKVPIGPGSLPVLTTSCVVNLFVQVRILPASPSSLFYFILFFTEISKEDAMAKNYPKVKMSTVEHITRKNSLRSSRCFAVYELQYVINIQNIRNAITIVTRLYVPLKKKRNEFIVDPAIKVRLVRGIALCSSLEEEFNRDQGVVKARGRAIKAMTRKQNYFPIVGEEATSIWAGCKICRTTVAFKAAYNVRPSKHEKEWYDEVINVSDVPAKEEIA